MRCKECTSTIHGVRRLFCTNRLTTEVTLSRTDSSHGFSDGYAERGEAVQDGHTDLELGNLTVEVPRHEALAQQFHTVHLGFDAAPAVITAPSSPDGSAKAFRCAQGFVACKRPGGVGFQGLAFLRGGITAAAPRAAMA